MSINVAFGNLKVLPEITLGALALCRLFSS
jgi:hypothetical protein